MRKQILFLTILLISFSSFAQELRKPENFFGFKPGSEASLFTYEKLIDYLNTVEKASDQFYMEKIGISPMGKPIYLAFISSKENIKNLENLKKINKELALNPNLTDSEKTEMIKTGKVFVLATLSMHSNEVGPSQAMPDIVYELLTTNDAKKTEPLNDVIYMFTPSHNPDGMNMVVNNFNEYKGTKYEGTFLPGLYHKYVGHDNNRDFIILSQSDTKAISQITSHTWFPQVMVEKHQMGSTGPRYFVPPNHDPIAENVDAELFIWAGIFGQNMINDMTNRGLHGIAQHYAFDNYWPGSTETCMWKNVISFLTEAASVKTAKSIYIEENELVGRGKGLSEYKKSTNMPSPWKGGWWKLSDILEYEIESTYSIINTAALHREKILSFRNEMCVREVNKGKTEAPYYYILPKKQKDESELVELVNLLHEHGIEVSELKENYNFKNTLYKKGDIVIPLAQPFRSFVKEVMEKQKFPERHYTPGGKLIMPYDITTWSLPLHKGLVSNEINIRDKEFESKLNKLSGKYTLNSYFPGNYEFVLLSSNNNESYKLVFEALKKGISIQQTETEIQNAGKIIPAGSFLLKKNKKLDEILKKASFTPIFVKKEPNVAKHKLKIPRIAFVETYFHDMDAGWTRSLFDTYGIDFTLLRPGDFEKTDFVKNFDLVIFPDKSADLLKDGKYKQGESYYIINLPPKFTKGIGKKGMENLMTFSKNGGIVISWGASTALFKGNLAFKEKEEIETFSLPFRDVSADLIKKGLYCPGSLVDLQLKKNHPLTYGLNKSVAVFYRGKPVFTTSQPIMDADRRVIGSFGEENVLLSGFIQHEELLAKKSAMLWLKKGKAQFILMGFSPIFRTSTPSSYKLLFNSILLPKL